VVCAVATALFLGAGTALSSGTLVVPRQDFCAHLRHDVVSLDLPRVRFDQLLNVCWKWLIPLGLANLVATAGYRQMGAMSMKRLFQP